MGFRSHGSLRLGPQPTSQEWTGELGGQDLEEVVVGLLPREGGR